MNACHPTRRLNSLRVGQLNSGFTLIEMLVVMTITAILLAIGVPAMSNFIERNRIAGNVNQLIADINLARNEAVSRHVRMVICPSVDAATCSGANVWSQGWIVFQDSGGVVGVLDAANDRVVRAFQGVEKINVTAGAATNLWFLTDGTGVRSDNLAGEIKFDFLRDPGNTGGNGRSLCVLPVSGRSKTMGYGAAC